MAATQIATHQLNDTAGIVERDVQGIRPSLDALKRRNFIKFMLDQGEAGVQFQITPAGLDYALPQLIPNLDGQIDRIRRVICDLKKTTSEELVHTGLSRLLIEHIALDFKKQGLLKTRSYMEGTMYIEDPSPEFCGSVS
jgi:hypothetical protein